MPFSLLWAHVKIKSLSTSPPSPVMGIWP